MTQFDRRRLMQALPWAATLLRSATAAPVPQYQVGAYYFANYHVDPRNEAVHGKGWTEWERVKRGEPKFPGHVQPKKPAWGYLDESDPKVFAQKIAAASGHGLTHFIFDWYFYNDGPFLNRALENGYQKAENKSSLKFALMWANHDWVNIQPAKRGEKHSLQYPGAVTRATFDKMAEYIAGRYFSDPDYWTIEGRPYFSVYELFRLVEGLGGIDATKAALQRFRDVARNSGHPGLHLNAVAWGVKILPNEKSVANPRELLRALGFDSATSYVWVHNVPLKQFPVTEYSWVAGQAAQYWRAAGADLGLPYHPNVTMGWDSSPRTCQSDVFDNTGYPFGATMGGNTPAAFERALRSVKEFLDSRADRSKIFNINAWNEWTEGSYLEPDTVNGMGYLEAIRRVFGL